MKLKNTWIAALMSITLITSCAKKNDDGDVVPTPKIYQFGTPAGFSLTARENGALISFTFNPAAEGGYHVYFGDTDAMTGFTGSIPSPFTTQANSIIVGNLQNGTTYYFAVAALKADGTESAKTATMTVVPAELPGNEVQKVVDAELEFCVDQLDKIKFKEGKMILTAHAANSDWPGQNNDCDIDGIVLHTREDVGDQIISRRIPLNGSWSPGSVGSDLNMQIYQIVTAKNMTITDLETREDKCAGISFSGNKVRVTAENDAAGIPNTISFDAEDCPENKAYNFIGGDAIKFKLHYVATD